MLLGIIKIFLILGCFRVASETDDWKLPAGLFAFGNALLFFIDGEYQIKDFLQLALATTLAPGVFFLVDRSEGAVWLAAVTLGTILLLVI